MSKQLIILLAFFSLLSYNVKSDEAFYPEPTFFSQDDQYFLHTVESGQTVYSISVMYNVSIDDIYSLNPGSKTVIKAGEKLKIPQKSGSYIYYTIQPEDNLYRVAQKYYMKGDDIIAVNPGLSIATFTIGKTIRIPTNLVTTPIQGGNEALNIFNTNSLLNKTYPPVEVNSIKIALLLPFGLNENSSTAKALRDKMVEYLEGFLMALKDLKKEGISATLQIFDIGSGTKDIQDILNKKEMQDINMLIGGNSDDQIKMLSRFSKENKIPYIIPFTSQSIEPFNNPNIYQINIPQHFLYSKASTAFINKFNKYNIIIVLDEPGSSNRKEFIDILLQDFQERKIPYKTVTWGANFYLDINLLLKKDQNNIIVPSDDSTVTLSKLTTPLKSIVDNQSDISLSLFGYPAWQVHSSTYSDDFFRLNTTFYTNIYSDPTSLQVKLFYSSFYKWYTRVLENIFPKYGMLGYDTGMNYIRLIQKYGSNMDYHINDLKYNGIQIDFYFQRVSIWGGFINTNMYFINYQPDYTITKTPIR